MQRKKVVKVKKTKSGKGKKGGKRESKADKQLDIEKGKANIALWELKLRLTNQTLTEYRESCRQLACANDELTNQLSHAERENLDSTAYWQRLEADKDEKINVLQKSLKSQEALACEQHNKLIEHYTLEINEMKELFRKRAGEFEMIQDGMKKIEEFQTRKAEMEQELSDIRKSMELTEKEYRENLNNIEYRFFKEKARLEKDAEQTIAQVEEQAHHEAVVQLDDASCCVFKENVRLNETLKHHMKEVEGLQKLANSLANENASLALDKKTLEMMAKKNAAQMVAQKEELSHLKVQVASLEQKIGEQDHYKEKMLVSSQTSDVELEKLKRVLSIREKELKHIKRLASAIVEQRTELEQFFHEALAQVKEEIVASRLQYKKEAQQAYHLTLKQATAGKLRFPPIRTFHNTPHSTNSVYSDMEKAARWTHQLGSQVEMSDLTWEQREQVLRRLFAKMNRQRTRKANNRVASPSEETFLADSHVTGEELCAPSTFITQAPDSLLPTNPNDG
ncbi:basal body-orientation factor 1 isoform X1 [Dunckerocampus dactyliophorus]|uniref:basal body-orientation factor 1 isoform X1 n=1 Tax=Dunckerocampus dactyliophorus TaxID=161453 RepID=UPI0024068368|nr:basal body-orientation factor 1 isoform X1 [Dunckerocampus dactyliophorus]